MKKRHFPLLSIAIMSCLLAVSCCQPDVEKKDGVLFIRSSDANIVMLSPEYINSIFPKGHSDYHHLFIKTSGLRVDLENGTIPQCGDTFATNELDSSVFLWEPLLHDKLRVTEGLWSIYCYECEEYRGIDVLFGDRRIKVDNAEHVPNSKVEMLPFGRLRFTPPPPVPKPSAQAPQGIK